MKFWIGYVSFGLCAASIVAPIIVNSYIWGDDTVPMMLSFLFAFAAIGFGIASRFSWYGRIGIIVGAIVILFNLACSLIPMFSKGHLTIEVIKDGSKETIEMELK